MSIMIGTLRSTISALPFRQAYNLYNHKLDVRTLLIRLRFAKIRKAYYRDLWEAAARNINAQFVPAENGFHQISRDGMMTIVSQTRVRLNDSLAESILIDKGLTQKLLARGNHPIPDHRELNFDDLPGAIEFLKQSPGALVVKPASGTGGGKGVTTNVRDEATLRRAFNRAARYCEKVLVEEHVEGNSYRLTYLGGQFIDAVRRGPPTVTGDGRSTIAQLIKLENRRRLETLPVRSIQPIYLDADCRNCLRRQNLSTGTRLPDGQTITLKTVINDCSSHDCQNVKNDVHPQIVAKGAEVVEQLGMTWAGLDIQCHDISLPPEDNDYRIIEVNAPPGIHHHYLIDDPASVTPVAEYLLEYIFTNECGVMRV